MLLIDREEDAFDLPLLRCRLGTDLLAFFRADFFAGRFFADIGRVNRLAMDYSSPSLAIFGRMTIWQ